MELNLPSLFPHRFLWTQNLRLLRRFLGTERFGSIWIDNVYSTMMKLELIAKFSLSNVFSIFFNIISCGPRTWDHLFSAFSTAANFLARKEPRNVIPWVPWKWIYYVGQSERIGVLESVHSAVHLVLHILTKCDIQRVHFILACKWILCHAHLTECTQDTWHSFKMKMRM